MDTSSSISAQPALTPEAVRQYLIDHPDLLRKDAALLAELGLTEGALATAEPGNVIDFGTVALARVNEAHRRESQARLDLEATAQANFAAQAQTHGAVIDLLEARSPTDLAARLDDLAQARLGLAAGVLALEGPEASPAGWRIMPEGGIDRVIGHQALTHMGFEPTALGLFGDRAPLIRSMALVRLALWDPAREGLLAFGSTEADGFSPDMGTDLVAFLARVIERTAGRWPLAK